MATTLASIVFVGVLLMAALAYGVSTSRHEAASLELARRLGPAEAAVHAVRARDLDRIGGWLGGAGTWLHELIRRAGTHRPVGAVVLTSAGAAGLGAIVVAALVDPRLAPLGLLLGGIPLIVLLRRADRRSRRLTQQLPDALDLIARALRSGHAFPEALRMAAAELPAPIAEELAPTAEEHRLGLDLRLCLEDLLRRVPDSFELRLFASAVLLHRETGGNLIEVLDQLAETVRERLVFEDKVHAMTAEVRTSARILEALPLVAAILLSVAAPGYLRPLVDPGLGRSMLIGAAVSMTIGVLTMRRIARVEP